MSTIDVVVIGPMEKRNGTSHTEALGAAVTAIIAAHGLRDRVTVTVPDELFGNAIPTDVFTAIDRAELVIADLSDQRSCVVYEIALADALGIPKVMVAATGTDLPFYFAEQRVWPIDDFGDAAKVRATIEPLLLQRVRNDTKGQLQNPLTSFYGAPVVDISAAEGLAAAYFGNFLGEIIHATQGLVVTSADVRTVLTVVPRPSSNPVDDWQEIDDVVLQVTGLKPREMNLVRPGVKTKKPRSFRIKIRGTMIVDLMTPVYAVDDSHRIMRLDPDDPVRAKMVEAMLARLLRDLDLKVRHRSVRQGIFRHVPLAQLAAALMSPEIRGWWDDA